MKLLRFFWSRRTSDRTEAQAEPGLRTAPASDCAIWNDVSRALDLASARNSERTQAESGRQ